MNPCNRVYQYAQDKLRFPPLALAGAWCVRAAFRLPIRLRRCPKQPMPEASALDDAQKRLSEAWERPFGTCTCEAAWAKDELDVSIVVPAYNAAAYLEECLTSALEQQVNGTFEIIAVDDGSTDRTADILDALAGKTPRLTVIHKANGGAASARNTALHIARGQYILFLDADDKLLPGAIDALLSKARETNADLIQGGWRYMNGPTQAYPDRVYRGDDVVAAADLMGVPWGKLVKRSLFRRVRYPEGFTSYEDTIIKYLVLRESRSVAMLSRIVYAWRKTPDGITASTERTPRAVQAYWAVSACESAAAELKLPQTRLSGAISAQQAAMVLMRLATLDIKIRQGAFDLLRAMLVPQLSEVSPGELPFANRYAAKALINGDRALLETLGKRWMFIA